MSRGREKLLTKEQLPQQHHNQSASPNVQEEHCQTDPSLLTTHDQVWRVNSDMRSKKATYEWNHNRMGKKKSL